MYLQCNLSLFQRGSLQNPKVILVDNEVITMGIDLEKIEVIWRVNITIIIL